MRFKLKKFFKLTALLFLLFFSNKVNAQFVCSGTNVYEKNVTWMRQFANDFGFASLQGSKETQCGMIGEDFMLCRKCDPLITTEQQKTFQPMLSAEKYKNWIERWNKEMRSQTISITNKDLAEEKRMGHAKSEETKKQFEKRNNESWGESFFFFHRELFKMSQFELTVSGQPCIGVTKNLPTQWNDKTWPAPTGKAAQTFLDKVTTDIKFIEDSKNLKQMTLNQLGLQVSEITNNLYLAYQDSKSEVDMKCNGKDAKNCDDLLSTRSAQTNKHYWMIHSYTDSIIGKWLKANDYEEISKDCSGKKKCYQWQGTYTATYPI